MVGGIRNMKNKAYHTIADLVGIPSERQWFIEDPKKYYKENYEEYDDRSVSEDEEDTIVWIGFIIEMTKDKTLWGMDHSFYLEDFTGCLEEILPEGLTINEDILNEDESMFEWVEVVNKDWESTGYVLACFDVDSDGFELFVCKKDVLEQLKEEAKKAGHRIDLAHNM
jgi:hypothetical protein